MPRRRAKARPALFPRWLLPCFPRLRGREARSQKGLEGGAERDCSLLWRESPGTEEPQMSLPALPHLGLRFPHCWAGLSLLFDSRPLPQHTTP